MSGLLPRAETPGAGPLEMDDQDFDFFRAKIAELAGISMGEWKRQLVRARLRSRVTELGLSTFGDYRGYLEHLPAGDPEWQRFINQLTTNKTEWFREPVHLDHLAKVFLPEWQARGEKKTLTVWCAAASTGEEAYSIALTLKRHLQPGFDFEILATDIDTSVLNVGRRGVYRMERRGAIPSGYECGAISVGTEELEGWIKIRDEIKQRIRFEQKNLLEMPYPWTNRFDVIFCRNVFIYFDARTIQQVVSAMNPTAAPGAVLYIGQCEAVQNHEACRWRRVGPSIFRK